MDNIGPEGYRVPLFVDQAVDIAPEQIESLRMLLAALGPHALSAGDSILRRIDIVPDRGAAAHINGLIAAEGGRKGTVTLGAHGPRGVAVPIEGSNDLSCHIVLAASLVQAIDPAHPSSGEIVSTLLEELRHTEYYARTWRRRGYVHPTAQHVDRCLVDFYANKLLDEYLVNRWKAHLLGTEALVEGANGMVTAAIGYPEPIADAVERSAATLAGISAAWAAGHPDVGPTWHGLLGWLWRAVFEPLTYDAGRRATWAGIDDILAEPRSSAFYRQHVAPHWAPILAQFERAHSSDTESEDALDQIVASLRDFAAALGASIRPHGEDCWVDIADRFASWR